MICFMAGQRRRLRVLLIIKGLGHGGAEKLLVDVVANGDSESFSYEVAYVLDRYDSLAGDFAVPVHSLGATRDVDLRWLRELRRILTSQKYDIVHFHLPYPASLGRLVVRTLPPSHRPRVVYTEHCEWNRVALPLRALNRATIHGDDALINVSESSRDALPRRIKERSEVIIHGIDLSQSAALRVNRDQTRAEVRAEIGIPPGDVMVLTVANLRAQKAYDVLLDAARIVLDSGAPITFVSVGHGYLKEQLEARRRALGLGDKFKFLGLRTDVLRIMTAADVFALPSYFEGLPVTLMEATSVGLPVVATPVGEIPRLFTDGKDALLVTPGDSVGLAKALERLAGDDELRRKLADSSLLLSSRFDVGNATRRIEQIYGDLPVH